MNRQFLCIRVLLVVISLAGCSSQPINSKTLPQQQYQGALNAAQYFRTEEHMARYFEDAVAYAMFPRVYRAGASFGAAYGNGWVFRDDGPPIGKTRVWQFSAGPHVGAQFYEQIIFFKTEETLVLFQGGTLEFAGQANLTVATVNVSWAMSRTT